LYIVLVARKGKGQQHRGCAKDKHYVCGCANREGVSGWQIQQAILPSPLAAGKDQTSRDDVCRFGAVL
jgi:hypothetical protein